MATVTSPWKETRKKNLATAAAAPKPTSTYTDSQGFTVGAGANQRVPEYDANGNMKMPGDMGDMGFSLSSSGLPYIPAGTDDSALMAQREALAAKDRARAAAAPKTTQSPIVQGSPVDSEGFVIGPHTPGTTGNNTGLLGGSDFVIGPTGSGNTSNGGSGANGGAGGSSQSTFTPPSSSPASGSPLIQGSTSYGSTSGYTAPAQVTASTYDPTTRQVTENQLVEHRLNNMLADDSTYMQRARAAGEAVANRRGLLNSSLAGQMSQAAAIDAARPIATEDANAYKTTAADNMNAANQAAEFNAGQTNQVGMLNTQEANAAYKAEMERQLKRDEMAITQATEKMKQASGQAATYLDGLSRIMSADMDPQDKQDQVDQYQNGYLDNMNSTIALGDFTIQNGQVVYSQSQPGATSPAPTQATDTESDDEEYVSGVTTNAGGLLVDKYGKIAPDVVSSNPSGSVGYYELREGVWQEIQTS